MLFWESAVPSLGVSRSAHNVPLLPQPYFCPFFLQHLPGFVEPGNWFVDKQAWIPAPPHTVYCGALTILSLVFTSPLSCK